MYRLISLAFVLSLTSVANAQLHVKPQTPTPTPLIREAFMPKGDVLLSYPKDAILDEKPIWHWGYHQRKLTDLVITNALGEKLTEEEIRKKLEKPTIVLVSADGKPVHPYYLKVIRPETLVIIDKTPKRESPNRDPVKLKTLEADPPKRATPKAMVDQKPQPEFKIEVRIVEFKPIKGVTKKNPHSKYHLHIKPALVVTPADIASVNKRWLRGVTTKTKHYPRLVVDIELTKEAKLRLRKTLDQTRITTTKQRIITTVLNDKHLGDWAKYGTDDPTSPVYWSKFNPQITFTSDKEKADKLIKFLEQSKKDQKSSQKQNTRPPDNKAVNRSTHSSVN